MYQFVIPIHHVNWSTRSVLEGISQKYKPKQIYVVTSDHEIKKIDGLGKINEVNQRINNALGGL